MVLENSTLSAYKIRPTTSWIINRFIFILYFLGIAYLNLVIFKRKFWAKCICSNLSGGDNLDEMISDIQMWVALRIITIHDTHGNHMQHAQFCSFMSNFLLESTWIYG